MRGRRFGVGLGLVGVTCLALAVVGCDSGGPDLPDPTAGGDGTTSAGNDTSGGGETGEGGSATCTEFTDPPVTTALLWGSDPIIQPLTEMCLAGPEAGQERFDIYIQQDAGLHSAYWELPHMSELMLDLDRLRTYDLLVVAQGADTDQTTLWESAHFDENAAAPNLRTFVREGGNILTSDAAFAELLFPEFIDFRGSEEIPPGDPEATSSTGIHGGAVDIGTSPELTPMTIVDADLRQSLADRQCEHSLDPDGPCADADGQITLRLHNRFPAMDGPHPGAALDILIEAEVDVTAGDFQTERGVRPLVVRFRVGEGTVIVSGVWFGFDLLARPGGQLFEELFERSAV